LELLKLIVQDAIGVKRLASNTAMSLNDALKK
jgi:hypothetical protein